jgi:4-hydroxy-3-polyprenylbenzoate decarboxylase
MRLVVGITGASGAIYGIRILEALRDQDVEVYLVITDWARKTIELESDLKIDYVYSLAHKVLNNSDLAASISSGSFELME